MKKTVKIISTILLITMILATIGSVVLAADSIPTPNPNAPGTDKITTMGSTVLGIIQVAGMVIAVGMLIVLGIKYMMGSTEEKAADKKSMIPYLIGAILLFAASAIVGVIQGFATGIK